MESLKEQRRNRTLLMLATVKVATTEQIGNLIFPDSGSPSKRASGLLRELEREKFTESQWLSNAQKVWRLSYRGRTHRESRETPIPLNSIKMSHYLGLTDCFLKLQKTGQLKYFETELRERYEHEGKARVFAPDAFLVWNKNIYLLELQNARLSQNQWAQKWRIYNEYFNERYFEKASWQRFGKGKFLKPQIVVVTKQAPENVVNGFAVEGRELNIVEDIEKITRS